MDCEHECYRIGGPWIAYNPDCPLHGNDARAETKRLREEERRREEARLQEANDLNVAYDQVEAATCGTTIYVWRWKDAPPAYRALSTHGGDEDGVAFFPQRVASDDDGHPEWFSYLWNHSDVQTIQLVGGMLYIWAH